MICESKMKQILHSKILVGHLIIVLLVSCVICGFLYILGIPLIYWFSFGEGEAAAQIESKPINIFTGDWCALISVLIAFIPLVLKNFRLGRFSRSKSYLITAPILVILYLFRFQIGEFFLGL